MIWIWTFAILFAHINHLIARYPTCHYLLFQNRPWEVLRSCLLKSQLHLLHADLVLVLVNQVSAARAPRARARIIPMATLIASTIRPSQARAVANLEREVRKAMMDMVRCTIKLSSWTLSLLIKPLTNVSYVPTRFPILLFRLRIWIFWQVWQVWQWIFWQVWKGLLSFFWRLPLWVRLRIWILW